MGLVAAKCTQCSANIEVDDTKEAGICKYCGTAFITEKVITNYNTYITNNFAGANINMMGANINVMGASTDNLLTLAKTAKELGNYSEAKDYYARVLENQPNNCEALVGKGLCSLYSSNLNDINPNELIGYISKAIDYKKKEENISETEIDQFIADSAIGLYEAAALLFRASQNHYYKYWKLESSAPEYWNRLSKVINIFLYAIGLAEPKNIQQTKEGRFCYLEGMKFVTMCCVEICKPRQYVSGIINPGQVLQTEEKRTIKPAKSLHQAYIDLYDNMCSKIRAIDPNFQPKEPISKIKGACYIATCVYGSYDCPQVWALRRYRDYTLDETWYGRIFIKCYYAISPTLVKYFGETRWFKSFWKSKLDKMVVNLKKKGIGDTYYEDKF